MTGQADSKWILGPCSNASGGWTTGYHMDINDRRIVNGYQVCVAMRPVDGLLNIIWMLKVSQANGEWILGLCRDGSSGWTIEYYLDINDGLGEQEMDVGSVQQCVQWMDH